MQHVSPGYFGDGKGIAHLRAAIVGLRIDVGVRVLPL